MMKMMIFERELGLMDDAGAIVSFTAIERREANKEWFELLVKLKKQQDAYIVTNARQSPRKWVQINTLIGFIRERCPKFVNRVFEAGEPALNLVISGIKMENKEYVNAEGKHQGSTSERKKE